MLILVRLCIVAQVRTAITDLLLWFEIISNVSRYLRIFNNSTESNKHTKDSNYTLLVDACARHQCQVPERRNYFWYGDLHRGIPLPPHPHSVRSRITTRRRAATLC